MGDAALRGLGDDARRRRRGVRRSGGARGAQLVVRAVAQWARDAAAENLAKVRGALLVAPSDPEGPSFPDGPTGFAPMPLARLPFRSIVVASRDDQYVTIERAREYAAAWGSELVDVGDAGHINASSGLGTWAVGYGLLQRLRTAQ